MVDSQEPVLIHYSPGTPQITECKTVLEVFKRFHDSFNLISDSAYIVNAVCSLEIAGPIQSNSTVCQILLELKN